MFCLRSVLILILIQTFYLYIQSLRFTYVYHDMIKIYILKIIYICLELWRIICITFKYQMLRFWVFLKIVIFPIIIKNLLKSLKSIKNTFLPSGFCPNVGMMAAISEQYFLGCCILHNKFSCRFVTELKNMKGCFHHIHGYKHDSNNDDNMMQILYSFRPVCRKSQ